MKTSNKLFLGFLGLVVLLMLSTDIVLRANYSKGITNSDHDRSGENKPITTTLPPFKVVLVTTASGAPQQDSTKAVEVRQGNNSSTTTTVSSVWDKGYLNIRQADKYVLTTNTGDKVQFRNSGDTLFLLVYNSGDIHLTAPQIEQVIAPSSHLRIDEMKEDRLTIITGPHATTHINDSRIGSLSFSGGIESTLDISEGTLTDSLKIRLDKASKLRLGASYKYGDIQVDSLREMYIQGNSIQNIKQIK
ncbi:hypothetical protein [Chitinophaga flava]|uniref:Uncharacterized protein n=1 Tax=Chitinophaga flava TaxID=2259036 RepID=A0A365Y2V4_9BACT|nr:hypothetical protein [Chitinophaga flava]RBL92932.1 hypothetical protein DF182_10255 [Chitinophaga flava]